MAERPVAARIVAAILCLTLATAAVIGVTSAWKLAGKEVVFMAGHEPTPRSQKDALVAALQGLTWEDGRIGTGVFLPLLRLVRSNGQTFEIVLLEGEFTGKTIDPMAVWRKQVLRPATLVSSISEYGGDGGGGISSRVAAGCSLAANLERRLQLGDVAREDCRGPYTETLGIEVVTSAALIVYSKVGGVEPCPWIGSSNTQVAAVSCVRTALDTALRQIFGDPTGAVRPAPSSLIIPALGTGTGQLPKGQFYDALGQRLVETLGDPSSTLLLPRRLILQIWRDESPAAWEESQYAIARMVTHIGQSWQSTARKLREQRLSMLGKVVGITATLAAMLGLALTQAPAPAYLRRHIALLLQRPILVTLGWGLASIGAAAIVGEVLEQLALEKSLWWSIVTGVAAVLAYPILDLAKDVVGQATKAAASGQ